MIRSCSGWIAERPRCPSSRPLRHERARPSSSFRRGYTDCGGRGKPAATAALTIRPRAQSSPASSAPVSERRSASPSEMPATPLRRRDLVGRLDAGSGLDQAVNRQSDRRDVVGPDDLRDEDALDCQAGHNPEVFGVPGVDADVDRFVARVCKQRGKVRARLGLRRRSDAVLEVDDHRVCGGGDRLLDPVGTIPRHVQPGQRRDVQTTPSRRSRVSSSGPMPSSSSTETVCSP